MRVVRQIRRPVGKCLECRQLIQITERSGLRVHGPVNRRCPGSGQDVQPVLEGTTR
jgi:hypothetical protein